MRVKRIKFHGDGKPAISIVFKPRHGVWAEYNTSTSILSITGVFRLNDPLIAALNAGLAKGEAVTLYFYDDKHKITRHVNNDLPLYVLPETGCIQSRIVMRLLPP